MGKYNRAKFTTLMITRDLKTRMSHRLEAKESYGELIERLLSKVTPKKAGKEEFDLRPWFTKK